MKINRDGLSIISRYPIKRPTMTITEAEKLVRSTVKVHLYPTQFSALVCFVVCRGKTIFLKSKLLQAINDDDNLGAAEQFKYHTRIAGKRRTALLNRRRAEKTLFLRPIIVIDRK